MTREQFETALNALEASKLPGIAEEIEALQEKLRKAALASGLAVVKILGYYYVRSSEFIPSPNEPPKGVMSGRHL